MELIATMRKLPEVLPEYRFSQHVESTLAEYCRFLERREDLLQLAQQYHDAIFEEKRYSLLEIEGLPELDGKEQGLLFAVLFLARCQLLDRVLEAKGIPGRYKAGTVYTCVRQLEKNLEYYGTVGFQGMYRSRMISWLEPNQFILGRLTFQISTFGGPYRVYRNR